MEGGEEESHSKTGTEKEVSIFLFFSPPPTSSFSCFLFLSPFSMLVSFGVWKKNKKDCPDFFEDKTKKGAAPLNIFLIHLKGEIMSSHEEHQIRPQSSLFFFFSFFLFSFFLLFHFVFSCFLFFFSSGDKTITTRREKTSQKITIS